MVQAKVAVKSLEDEMYETMAKEIAREMDEGIMANILIETGWTPIEFYFKSNEHVIDITEWLNQNCESQWRRLGSHYLFENVKDAEWFILRWL